MFTKYGYTTIGITSIISFLIIVLAIFLNNNIAKFSLITVAVLLMAFTLYFFRDPDRNSPQRDDIVVSPADGRVLFVKEVVDNKFINGRANQISIFMSPLNVHVNRTPITGRVDYLEYFEGKYIAAFEDKASELNERMEIGIQTQTEKYFLLRLPDLSHVEL